MKRILGGVLAGITALVAVGFFRLSEPPQAVEASVSARQASMIVQEPAHESALTREAVAEVGQAAPFEAEAPDRSGVADLLADSEAVAAFRQSIEQGDPRTPSIVRAPEEPAPPESVLESPEAYADWEASQERALKRRFALAAQKKIALLEKEVARARAMGLDAESLREGEEKVRRLREAVSQIRAEYPDLFVSQP